MRALATDVVLEPDPPPPPVDDPGWAALDASSATAIASQLPLSSRFRLQERITSVQRAFLDKNGFLVFDRVASPTEIDRLAQACADVEADLIGRGVTRIHGIPIWIGRGPGGRPWIQRMGFTSVMSDVVRAFVRDPRFEPIRTLIGQGARVGDQEKDGVVLNRYANLPGSLRPNLGWHTDALRDVLYNRTVPGPMLNVGLHFDRVRPEDGGLRLLPGTHTQNAWAMVTHKIHFVSQAPDPREIAVETWPGDLTVHDGRMWHRVQASPHRDERSIRRSMYVPYVIDAWNPKDERSSTPIYLRVFDVILRAKKWWNELELRR